MNAEPRTIAEPAERSTGVPHVARRILIATLLGSAMLVLLGGRSRADVLDPAQTAADGAADVVGQVVDTATDAVGQTTGTLSGTVSTVVDSATDTAQPVIQTTADVVDPIVGAVTDTTRPVREAAGAVLPGTNGAVPRDPSTPQLPIWGVTPAKPGTSAAPHADAPRSSTEWSARTDIASAAASWPSSSIAHPGSYTDGAPSAVSRGSGGSSLPFGPLGRAGADGPLTLLVLFAAMTASLLVRPPPIRSLLAPSVVAPNGAALALSVERPG